jgi:hypothetical protein
MLNFNPELTDLRALQTNQRALELHINDDHYVRDFSPGDFVLGGSAGCVHAQIPAATPRWAAVTMPKDAVANSIAVVNFRKPSQWRSGRLCVRFWYTSPTAGATNFWIQVNLDAARTGEVLPATNLMALTAAYSGPAVANTKLASGAVYSTVSFGADDEDFGLRVIRLSTSASDTNPNAMNLLRVEVEHIPAQAVSS